MNFNARFFFVDIKMEERQSEEENQNIVTAEK